MFGGTLFSTLQLQSWYVEVARIMNGLIGVAYSEFDNEVGPRLLYQYPAGILSPKSFESISDYVIVGKHLCEKIMIIKIDGVQVLNFSVAIENKKVLADDTLLCQTLTGTVVWTKHTIFCIGICLIREYRHGRMSIFISNPRNDIIMYISNRLSPHFEKSPQL